MSMNVPASPARTRPVDRAEWVAHIRTLRDLLAQVSEFQHERRLSIKLELDSANAMVAEFYGKHETLDSPALASEQAYYPSH